MNKNHDIVKSNALVEACYKPISLNQMRLLLVALTQVKAGEKIKADEKFIIKAEAISDLAGPSKAALYRDLKQAAADLYELSITVDRGANGKERPGKFVFRAVSACDYMPKKGCVELYFTKWIIPYISGLQSHFTKYKAKQVMDMRSSYGIRLYELCLQWLAVGREREFSVLEFRSMFGLGKKYLLLSKLKEKVIKPAMADVNTFSDLNISFGQRKDGHKITHFQFMVTKKKKDTAVFRHVLNKKYIELKSRPGESWEQATARLSSEANPPA